MNEKKIYGIKPASQVREETHKTEEFEAACFRVMADIDKASAEGRYHTLFDPRPNHLDADIQAAFKREGYEFRPVGNIAGVMQRELYICW